MSDIKWIKIMNDIFDDEKILLIETLPEGDSVIVIWFKLLCLAGKQNNNGVFLMNDRIPYTAQMLATIFRRKSSTVEMALNIFEEYGMIEIINDTITIPKWEYHQNIDSLDKIREDTRKRVAKYREKQKALSVAAEKGSNTNVTLPVTLRNDQEEEEEEEEEEDIYNYNMSDKSRKIPEFDEKEHSDDETIREIIAYLNGKLGTHYKTKAEKTRKLIRARLREEYTKDDFFTVIDKMTRVWKGTPMEQYLRPETLFGTKFEGYLNRTDKTEAELAAEAELQKKYGGLMQMFSREGADHDTGRVYQADCDNVGQLPEWEGV